MIYLITDGEYSDFSVVGAVESSYSSDQMKAAIQEFATIWNDWKAQAIAETAEPQFYGKAFDWLKARLADEGYPNCKEYWGDDFLIQWLVKTHGAKSVAFEEMDCVVDVYSVPKRAQENYVPPRPSGLLGMLNRLEKLAKKDPL